MTIDEVMGRLDRQRNEKLAIGNPEDANALWIAKEALKREQVFRERVPKSDWRLLPGETE